MTIDSTYSLASSAGFGRLVVWAAALLVVKVTLSIVLGYRDSFPPNFQSDFLVGRQSYFFGGYRWAFYAHIVAGPVALCAGLALVSERFRRRPLSENQDLDPVSRSDGKL